MEKWNQENDAQDDTNCASPSVFDELRQVARGVDRQMVALRRARHDPLAFGAHDPTETLLGLRAEIDGLRRRAADAADAELAGGTALHDLAAAAGGCVDQWRLELDAAQSYLSRYGYQPPPPPVVAAAEPANPDPTGDAHTDNDSTAATAHAGSVGKPAAERRTESATDTPEEVQLSDVTVHVLRNTARKKPAALAGNGVASSAARGLTTLHTVPQAAPSPARVDDDTESMAALLNMRKIEMPLCSRFSPAPRGLPPPNDDRHEVTPGLWVRRRSMLPPQQPLAALKENRLPLRSAQLPPNGTWVHLETRPEEPLLQTGGEPPRPFADSVPRQTGTPSSPVLSSFCRQLLLRRQVSADAPTEPVMRAEPRADATTRLRGSFESPDLSDITRTLVPQNY